MCSIAEGENSFVLGSQLFAVGIRGEVKLMVKVEILKDQHRFKQSSCGIMFFVCEWHSRGITYACHVLQAVLVWHHVLCL